MPITWVSGGLTARAEAFSESEEFDLLKPPTADVKLRVPWSQRHAVAQQVAGMQWPYYSTVPMYCVHAKVGPVPQSRQQSDGDGNIYNEAFVELHFDPFTAFTETLKTNGEMLKVNRFGLDDRPGFMIIAWDVGSGVEGRYQLASLEEAPTKIIMGCDYEVNFEQLDEIPPEVLTLVDCVNGSTVSTINLGLDFDPETILLLSSDAKHTVSVDGSVKNSLSLKLGWRKNTWNKFWRASTGEWEYLYVLPIKDEDIPRLSEDKPKGFDPDPGGPAPAIYRNFPTADFSALLPS